MDIYIYDTALTLCGVVSRFGSLRWRRKYFEPGEVELHLPITAENLASLLPGRYLLRKDAVEAAVITGVRLEGDDMTVTGRMLSQLLGRRVIYPRMTFTGTAEEAMRQMVTDATDGERALERLYVADAQGYTQTADFTTMGTNLAEALTAVARSSGLGYRVRPDFSGAVNTGRLPQGYTELNHIRSSGTQYIDTGFAPNQDSRVVMDIESVASHGDVPLFGARVAYKNTAYSMWLRDAAIQTDYNAESGMLNLTTTRIRFQIDKNKNITTAAGVTTAQSATTFQSAYTAYLFALNQAGQPNASGMVSIKMYSCQMYDNGTLVRDFVPCTDPSGIAGLYDLANGKFYRSAGTADFIAGPAAPTVDRILLFEAYQGRDLSKDQSANPRVVLTDASLLSPTYTWDSSIHKNLAYVYTDTQVLTVDSSNGEERRELWVNGNDINPEDYPTTAAYTAALIQRGIDRLAELPIAESFESGLQATANGYKTAWDLGDIVTVRMTRWNKTASARVTEVEEIYEGGTAEIIPVLGSPLPEKLMIGDGF